MPFIFNTIWQSTSKKDSNAKVKIRISDFQNKSLKLFSSLTGLLIDSHVCYAPDCSYQCISSDSTSQNGERFKSKIRTFLSNKMNRKGINESFNEVLIVFGLQGIGRTVHKCMKGLKWNRRWNNLSMVIMDRLSQVCILPIMGSGNKLCQWSNGFVWSETSHRHGGGSW